VTATGKKMFVYYYMTPEPVTITSESTVSEATDIINRHGFRHLPVVDEQMVLQGMVTDRDLRSVCPSTILDPGERKNILARVSRSFVLDIMSKDFFQLQASATIDDALQLFTNHRIGTLPVVNRQQQVVGIFSLNDMMAAYQKLFGLGERGSMLIAIKDSGKEGILGVLAKGLDEQAIECSRLIRSPGRPGHEPAAIYLRVNTCNASLVHRVVEQAGLCLLSPKNPADGGNA